MFVQECKLHHASMLKDVDPIFQCEEGHTESEPEDLSMPEQHVS